MLTALAVVVGLILGSFLNVVIARLPYDESIVTPRSRCPHCARQLCWYDNIPLLSFLFLRGRCRDCREAIGWIYPAVEAGTAAWFVISVHPLSHASAQGTDALLQLVLACLSNAVLGWLLIGVAVVDWRHHIVPNEFSYGGMFVGMLFACTSALFLGDAQADVVLQHPIHLNSANAGRSTGNIFLTGPEHVIFGHLFAAVAAFLLLYVIRTVYRLIRSRDGLGLGDAKLFAMIATFLGFAPGAVALALGVVIATGYAVTLLISGKAHSTLR